MEIGCIILCKDEGYELGKCLRNNMVVEILGGENVIVVSSSDISGEMLEVEKMICKDFGVKLVEKRIGDKEINGIGDLRNFGGLISRREWVLYIDVDELFSVKGLEKLGDIVKSADGLGVVAFRYPRINLPFYERWPDYQTRLVNIRKCAWQGDVHEGVGIVDIVNEKGDVIKGGEFGVLREYPIIHKDIGKERKLIRNKRWSGFGKKNVIVCSLFKDSEWYMDRFLECISKMIKYSSSRNIGAEIYFVEGNSEDNTQEKLNNWFRRSGFKGMVEKMDINDSGFGRFDKLGLLRNMLIKVGLKGRHDYVLMIDSDVVFDEDLLVRLIDSISKKKDVGVVGTLVMVEGFRTFGNDYFYDTLACRDMDGNKFIHYFPYISDANDSSDIMEKCFQVSSVGTCYLVKSEVYNIGDLDGFSVIKCYNEIESGKKVAMYRGEKKSEQIRWCDSVRERGYNIMINSKIRVLHLNLEKHGRKWH